MELQGKLAGHRSLEITSRFAEGSRGAGQVERVLGRVGAGSPVGVAARLEPGQVAAEVLHWDREEVAVAAQLTQRQQRSVAALGVLLWLMLRAATVAQAEHLAEAMEQTEKTW
jgi:hypothetical protein